MLPHYPTNSHGRRLGRVAALGILAAVAISPGAAWAEVWNPVASERLMHLPGDSLAKAVENDYARSGLALELTGVEEQIAFKQTTLGDLQKAIERADTTDLKHDLQYQFLEEKKNYLELMQTQHDLRKKRAETKVALYEKLLARANRLARPASPEQATLLSRQKAARDRMEATTASVDMSLLAATAASSSRYSTEYRENLAAIQQLSAAIAQHPMNRSAMIDGEPVSREEYLRQLIADSQGEVALVEQEGQILGHMAKLVSLDALALAEGIGEANAESDLATGSAPATSVSSLVDLFITRQ